MVDKKKYIIAITKENALFPQNWDEQNYFDIQDNFDVFFIGELSEEELEDKFRAAIKYVLDNVGSGEKFLPVFVYDENGDFLYIEGSGNIKRLRYNKLVN